MSRVRRSASSSMSTIAWSRVSGSSVVPRRRRIRARPKIVVTGVRSSWLMTPMKASRRAAAWSSSSWCAATSTAPASTLTTDASRASSSGPKASTSVESTSTSPIPTPFRTMGTPIQDRTAVEAATPRILSLPRIRSPVRYGSRVSTTCQLRPRFRGSRWPSASTANGPMAARITRLSPSTRAIDPPVSRITPRNRSSASARIWSRSSSPDAAAAISMISRDVASERMAGSRTSPVGLAMSVRGMVAPGPARPLPVPSNVRRRTAVRTAVRRAARAWRPRSR